MSIAVAPLTTTVMGAVEARHAGTASGINNAVSRTAGLLAVAAFGVVLVSTFERRFSADVNSFQIPAAVKQQLLVQGDDLAEIKIPESVPAGQKSLVTASIRNSFIGGFRLVTIIAAALGLLSSIMAWILIPGKAVGAHSKK